MNLRNNKKKDRVIYYDFETTGLNPYRDQIIEIGAIDNCELTFSKFCKYDGMLNPKITEITGITDEILEKKGIDCSKAIKEFVEFLYIDSELTNNIVLIAHNNDAFDELFLKFHIQKYLKNFNLPSNIIFIDSLRLAQLTLTHMKYFSQPTLCKYYNIENPAAHRAIHDAETLKRLFSVIITIFNQKFGSKDFKFIKNKLMNPFS